MNAADHSPPVVLVVDDDPDHALMLELSLERLGYAVIAAHSVREARSALELNAVDALVSDLTLGDGTALDVVEGMRRPRATIVLSGSDNPDDLERCSRAGFEAYLVKPAAADLVGKIIGERLRRRASGTLAKPRIDDLGRRGAA